jgi:hypothetical protein
MLLSRRKDSPASFYPCLKEFIRAASDESFVVLFTEPRTGMVVWADVNAARPVGDFDRNWDEDDDTFRPYHGRITLQY